MNGYTPEERRAMETCPLLAGMERTAVDKILAQPGAVTAAFGAGQEVYTPDRFQRRLGILLSGELRVTKGSLSVSVLEPGDLFGAAALYSDGAFSTTITALRDSRCLLLEQELVDDLLANDCAIRANYLGYLTGRIRFLSGRLQSLAQPGAEGKLARYLLANGGEGKLTCSATDLAKRLGISRASLYRAFEAMEEAGLISRKGKTIFVNDPSALEDVL